jgi:hypothetical protein
MKRTESSWLRVAVVLMAVCGTNAMAAIIGPFNTSTPIPLSPTDLSGTLVLPQFDPTLGILTAVQLDLSTTFITSLSVQNNSASSSSGTAKTQVQFTVQDLGNHFTVPAMDLLSPGFSYRLAPGQSVESGELTRNSSVSQVLTLASVLAEFTGTGDIGLSASTATLAFRANTGGNTFSTQVTEASLTCDVIYTYTATVIPEPATLGFAFGLPALVLGALPLLRRQRQLCRLSR